MRTKNPDLLKEHISIVNRVVDLVDERLETELTLETIASEVAVSPYYLHRMFTKVTEESLHKHVLRNRIHRAVHHLLYSRSLRSRRLDTDAASPRCPHFQGLSSMRWVKGPNDSGSSTHS